MRIELLDAAQDDYAALRTELERQGFSHAQSEKIARTAHYTFRGDADVEAVAKLAQQSAMKTGRRFLIFVSDSIGKGLGIAG